MNLKGSSRPANAARRVAGKSSGMAGPASPIRRAETAQALEAAPSKLQNRGHQRMLGVLLRKGTWPMYGFFKEALQGIQRVAFSQGYGLVIVDPPPQKEADPRELMASLQNAIDGVLLVAPRESDTAFFNVLTKEKFPVVVLYRRSPRLCYVEVDNEGGARAAVEHLIKLGHSRIAFIGGPPDAIDAQERLAGYLKALTQNGLPYGKEYVLTGDFEQAKAYKAMKTFLSLKKTPTAVFAANDYMALGAISAIQDEGLSVPGHIAVVGFDDLDTPALTFRAPSLTTVRQPIYDIAKEGTEILILLAEGRVSDLRQKIFPSLLIVRTTCGASLKKPSSE